MTRGAITENQGVAAVACLGSVGVRSVTVSLPFVALLVITAGTSHSSAPREAETVAVEVDKCVLALDLDGHRVFTAGPKCKETSSSIRVRVPSSGAAHVHVKYFEYYANGGISARPEEDFFVPILPGLSYVASGGRFAPTTTPAGTDGGASTLPHCVNVKVSGTDARRFESWRVDHFGRQFGPCAFGAPQLTGGPWYRHSVTLVAHDDARSVSAEYHRVFLGSYEFTVGRGGAITLTYSASDRCAVDGGTPHPQ